MKGLTMSDYSFDMSFYKGKQVLVTGHTGFKGAWLTEMLLLAGAKVSGYSTCTKKDRSMFDMLHLEEKIRHFKGDIRDLEELQKVFDEVKPEIVIHMAAQPLVRKSYSEPVLTYETNVMGTVNVLECIRHTPSVKSFLNVTTDKVYENKEVDRGYTEDERLNGFDPYSNSKSCSELVTSSYKKSFFTDGRVAVSTSRAGNAIGGGDFNEDRIIPDCVKAAMAGEDIVIRNPYSIRPYQHVIENLYAYLIIAAAQYENGKYAGNYNVGPDDTNCLRTGELADLFVRYWGDGIKCVNQGDGGPHEAGFLKLDNVKMKKTFGWKPFTDISWAVEKSVEWYKAMIQGRNLKEITDRQIKEKIRI